MFVSHKSSPTKRQMLCSISKKKKAKQHSLTNWYMNGSYRNHESLPFLCVNFFFLFCLNKSRNRFLYWFSQFSRRADNKWGTGLLFLTTPRDKKDTRQIWLSFCQQGRRLNRLVKKRHLGEVNTIISSIQDNHFLTSYHLCR